MMQEWADFLDKWERGEPARHIFGKAQIGLS